MVNIRVILVESQADLEKYRGFKCLWGISGDFWINKYIEVLLGLRRKISH